MSKAEGKSYKKISTHDYKISVELFMRWRGVAPALGFYLVEESLGLYLLLYLGNVGLGKLQLNPKPAGMPTISEGSHTGGM